MSSILYRASVIALSVALTASGLAFLPAASPLVDSLVADRSQGLVAAESLQAFGAGSTTWTNHADTTNGAGDLLGMGSGEPTIGVNWNIGDGKTALFQSGPRTMKVTFDDSVTPPTGVWTSVTPPLAAPFNNDPVLFTDPGTGRTWAGGLVIVNQVAPATVLDNTGCSILSFTDDNGATWNPVADACSLPGWDHQSITAGPWSATGPLPDDTLSDRAVYYCAQQAEKYCWVSHDGGTTFTPLPPPDPLLNCAQLFGKMRVSGDGTVYMPINHCPISTGPTSVMVSTDNGLTWSIRKVLAPGSGTGDFDPSVSPSLETAPGASTPRIYLGQAESDGAYIAVSDDRGLTWNNVGTGHGPAKKYFNVFEAYNAGKATADKLKRAEFAQVIAGDLDRAAFAFLGSTSNADAHDCSDPTPVHEWHMYVAMTYDGGQTWQVTKATTDPVQRGGIQSIGGGTTGCRNLLDFNDVTMDKEGRVLVAYADGCVSTSCKGASGTPSQSTANVATITRQATGKGLLAEYDGEDEPLGNAQVTISSPTGASTVEGPSITVSGAVDRDDDSSNGAPTAAFSCTTSSLAVTCTDSSSDADGSVAGWDWDWGDGSTHSTTQHASHTYATAGLKTIFLVVTDDAGLTDSVSHGYTLSSGGGGSLPAVDDDLEGSLFAYNQGGIGASNVLATVTGLTGDPVPKYPGGTGVEVSARGVVDAQDRIDETTPGSAYLFKPDGTTVIGPVPAAGYIDNADLLTGEALDYGYDGGSMTMPLEEGRYYLAFSLTIDGAEHFIKDTNANHETGLKPLDVIGTPEAPGGNPAACATYWTTEVGSPEEEQAAADCDAFLQDTTGGGEACGLYSVGNDLASCLPAGSASAPLLAPTAPPVDAEITDPAGDALVPVGSPLTQEDIRAAWFDEDAHFLYIGLKIEDVPADPTATAFINYAVTFKPDWTTTWPGVPAENTFTGLRVTALYSPVTDSGPSETTQYELQHLSTSTAGSEFGTSAVLVQSSLSVDTDIIWWVVPKAYLMGVQPGDELNTLGAAVAPAVGGLVTLGSVFGDTATSTATYEFATATTVPGAPTGLVATPGNGQVALAWTAPASNGGSAITGYTVNYGTVSGALTSTLGSAVTSATVTGLTNDQPYFFTVKASNGVGTGPATAELSSTPSENAAPERVEVYEGNTLLGSVAVTSTLTGGAVSWSRAVTLADGPHTLTAKWFDEGVASTATPLDTAEVTFTVGGGVDPCDTDQDAPTLSAVSVDPARTSALVTWTTDEASTSVVHYGTTAAYGQTATTAGMATSHSVSLSGLSAATTYHFEAVSADACENADASPDATFTTDAEEPQDTDPFVSIDSPADGAVLSAADLTVSGRAGNQVAQDLDANGDGFVVIAVPDTGINPYHRDFWGATYPRNTDADPDNDVDFRANPATYLEGFPANVPSLDLTIDGTFRLSADIAKFSALPVGQLRWIPGTKIIGAYDAGDATTANGAADTLPLFDDEGTGLFAGGHGTASASVAAGNLFGSCKECLLVAVESFGGDAWAFSQDWIDIVSVSGGPIANIPDGPIGILPEPGRFIAPEGQLEAVERGMSLLYAGGNGNEGNFLTPGQTYLATTVGPGWNMRVGAVNNDPFPFTDGSYSIVQSNKPVDISSYGSGNIPAACNTDATGDCGHSGTSSATPITAGHLGELILRARELLGDGGRSGTYRDTALGAGVVASGTPVDGNLYLADGVFTRAEAWYILKQAASPLAGSPIDFNHIVTVGVGASPVDYAYAGYGVADDAAEARALAMLEQGTAQLRDTTEADAFFALDQAVRTQLWGGWDDDADTVGTGPAARPALALDDLGLDALDVAAEPELLIDAFPAAWPSTQASGPGVASLAECADHEGRVDLYVEGSATAIGSADVGVDDDGHACSSDWTIDVSLAGLAYGDHTLQAVYGLVGEDGFEALATDDIDISWRPVVEVTLGEPLDVALLEGVDRLFTVAVPAGHELLSIAIDGPACTPDPVTGCPFDADLYVRAGQAPTGEEACNAPLNDLNDAGCGVTQCAPAEADSDESCDFTDPVAGTWHIRLHPFAGSGTVTLTADVDLPDMDGDGTPDARDFDRDGDGVENDVEVLAGLDPDDAGLPQPGLPSTGCGPDDSSTLGKGDLDGDGIPAVYVAGGSDYELQEDGALLVTPRQERCWAAGDPDDDGTWHLPRLPDVLTEVVLCGPDADATLGQKDADRDGVPAVYLSKGTDYTLHEDGSVTVQPRSSPCWVLGDPDDDSLERVPAPAVFPEVTVCASDADATLGQKDADRDGVPALYVSKGTDYRLHEDGSVTMQPRTAPCWFAGDPDDDGFERAPSTPTAFPEATVCANDPDATFGQKDADRDGVPALYVSKGTDYRLHEDGSVTMQPRTTPCWFAGDPDDDGRDRMAPPPPPDTNLGDGFVALIAPGGPEGWLMPAQVWQGGDLEVFVDAFVSDGARYGPYEGPLMLVVQRDCGALEPAAAAVVECQTADQTLGPLLQPTLQDGNHYTFAVDAATIREALAGQPAMGVHVFVQTGAGQDSHHNAAKEHLAFNAAALGWEPGFQAADSMEAGSFSPILIVDESAGSSSAGGPAGDGEPVTDGGSLVDAAFGWLAGWF